MDYQFKIGDAVCVEILDICGRVVSIELPNDNFIRFAGFQEDVPLYKVKVTDSYFITTTGEALRLNLPERVTDEN